MESRRHLAGDLVEQKIKHVKIWDVGTGQEKNSFRGSSKVTMESRWPLAGYLVEPRSKRSRFGMLPKDGRRHPFGARRLPRGALTDAGSPPNTKEDQHLGYHCLGGGHRFPGLVRFSGVRTAAFLSRTARPGGWSFEQRICPTSTKWFFWPIH